MIYPVSSPAFRKRMIVSYKEHWDDRHESGEIVNVVLRSGDGRECFMHTLGNVTSQLGPEFFFRWFHRSLEAVYVAVLDSVVECWSRGARLGPGDVMEVDMPVLGMSGKAQLCFGFHSPVDAYKLKLGACFQDATVKYGVHGYEVLELIPFGVKNDIFDGIARFADYPAICSAKSCTSLVGCYCLDWPGYMNAEILTRGDSKEVHIRDLQACAHCDAVGTKRMMKSCSGCGTIYCSKECAKADWRLGHKAVCKLHGDKLFGCPCCGKASSKGTKHFACDCDLMGVHLTRASAFGLQCEDGSVQYGMPTEHAIAVNIARKALHLTGTLSHGRAAKCRQVQC